jgi:hypothetical protein
MTENMEKLAKYEQDLERYKSIVNYFKRNPKRIFMNKNPLEHVDDSLTKIYYECKDINAKELRTKLRGILEKCSEEEKEKNRLLELEMWMNRSLEGWIN